MFKPTLKKKSSINIIPMIDVIFFLLVFFMLFTTFRTYPYGMEMELHQAETATEQTEENVVINIDGNGDLYFGDEEVSINQLRQRFIDQYADNKNIVIIINADRNTRYENLIMVMDNLREQGFYNLFLAAEREIQENS